MSDVNLKTSRRNGMMHLNNNLMCVVDCETTGNRPGVNDIYQICILPLDKDLKPYKTIIPFYCNMKLKRPDDIDPKVYRRQREAICRANTEGLDPDRAADLFDEWFAKLELPFNKQIVPLAQNWPFDRGFIIDWLGHESFEQYFSPLYRDTMTASLFMNDHADFHNERVPFQKNSLRWMTTQLGIIHDNAYEALSDCLATAELYRLLCKGFIK